MYLYIMQQALQRCMVAGSMLTAKRVRVDGRENWLICDVDHHQQSTIIYRAIVDVYMAGSMLAACF